MLEQFIVDLFRIILVFSREPMQGRGHIVVDGT